MIMCLSCLILVVLLDLLGQHKRSGDGTIPRIYSLNWILGHALTSMDMVSDLVENELNTLLKNDGH